MPKIEWTQIEGYREGMSAEEKLALLESLENSPTPAPAPAPKPTPTPAPAPAPAPAPTPDPDPAPAPKGQTVSKAQYDKVSSELAAAKKQLRAKMTEDEQKEADRVAAQEAMQEELETLRKEKKLSTYKASYLAQGYDEALAEATATAMVEGDMELVFVNMKKHSEAMEKNLRAKILKETPVPPPGDDPEGKDKKNKEMAALREAMGLPPLK